MNENKIKNIIEWLVSIALKFRLRKTYWSIATPLGLFLLCELAKTIDFPLKLSTHLYETTDTTWLKSILWGIKFYFELKLPWWSILFVILLLVVFTCIYLFELKVKKLGENASVEDITNSIIEKLNHQLSWNPDKDWFENQCEKSIQDLGNRYTPKLNFELEQSKIFDALGRTEKFEIDVTEKIDNVITKGKKILKDDHEIKDKVDNIKNNIDKLYLVFHETDFKGTSRIETNTIQEIASELNENANSIYDFYLSEERSIQSKTKDYGHYHKYGYELRNIREFIDEIHEFRNFIDSSDFELVNSPILILDGEAGIGKSHMLGDVISKRIRFEYESIFLLGQQFTTEEDPWSQIFARLQIDLTTEDFLIKLNQRGESSGKRIIIFIDAINEGKGKYFWPNYINSFINEVRKYAWLGLVLSIRSSYKDLIFPSETKENLNITEYTLFGFRNVEYEASKLFFDNYGIELPSVPLLHPEFQNPLFLKLFCEGIKKSGLTRIPDGIQGISSIVSFFINGVNNTLSNPNKLNYSKGINLVKKAVDCLIKYKAEYQTKYIPYETAYEIVESEVLKFTSHRGFIDDLIIEGVLSKNLFWKNNGENEEGIYLAYERFEDHLTAQYLLEKFPNLDIEFGEKGELFSYVKDEHSIYLNKGLVDAFSIQVPEKTGKELHEYIPQFKDTYPIVESFVESLLWRRSDTINGKSKEYINEYAFAYEATYNLFWETILSVTSNPVHYFNAYSLHEHLMRFSLADRDEIWTQNLKNKYTNQSSVKRLIDWAWTENDKSHISDESIKLSSIALTWFHTSTNRRLRDCSTKALISLLQDRINVLIELLKLFETVNDPYVYERLFAVAYGCALRTTQKEFLPELSIHIYKVIFDVVEVYPHILLRDYARGIIEYTLYLGYELNIDTSKIKPPYKSYFQYKNISNEEIDEKYEFDYKSEKFKPYYWAQNSILSSMTTEYGRGTAGYGDFGRYTFESALRDFDVNTNLLSNIAIEWIFEKYGYDVEKHGEFDRSIGSGRGRDSVPNERIGKKYQWLAFYEMLARVSDNCKKYDRWYSSDKEEISYEGTWDPYVRDIDPTILIKNTGDDEKQTESYWWESEKTLDWAVSNKDWVNDSKDLPDFSEQIVVKDKNGEEWLILEAHPDWVEPKKIGEEDWDYPRKQLWTQIRSYLVKDKDYESLIKWAVKQDFMGRWMPESRDRYEVFSREYYWSSAYKYFLENYYEGTLWREIHDKKSGEYITDVMVTTESFLWEEEFDYSKDGAIRYLKPCKSIYEGINLRYSRREGYYTDETDNTICFATNVYNNSKSYLLIKKEPFIEYLEKNNLKIIWTIIGEKQIIGGYHRREFIGRLEVSGVYYLNKSEIQGEVNTKTSL